MNRREDPECGPLVAYPASDVYMQHVAALTPAAAWQGVTAPALVMYAGSDFITSREEHLELVEAINRAHPGQATFAEVAGIDHYFSRQASAQASFDDPTPALTRPYYGATLEPVLLTWLDRNSGRSGETTTSNRPD